MCDVLWHRTKELLATGLRDLCIYCIISGREKWKTFHIRLGAMSDTTTVLQW